MTWVLGREAPGHRSFSAARSIMASAMAGITIDLLALQSAPH